VEIPPDREDRMRTLAAVMIIAALFSANAWAQADLDQATKVRDYYAEWLSSLPGVNGVDVGTSIEGRPQIQVHIDATTPRPSQLPQQLDGVPVAVIARTAEGNDSAASPSAPPLVPQRERDR
jgi:hypothetical protein